MEPRCTVEDGLAPGRVVGPAASSKRETLVKRSGEVRSPGTCAGMQKKEARMTGIPLAAAIGELRREIAASMEAGSDEALQFQLGPIELELQVELEQSETAEGGIKAWVLSLGASAAQTSAATHRIKLTLDPKTATGGEVLVKRTRRRKAE